MGFVTTDLTYTHTVTRQYIYMIKMPVQQTAAKWQVTSLLPPPHKHEYKHKQTHCGLEAGQSELFVYQNCFGSIRLHFSSRPDNFCVYIPLPFHCWYLLYLLSTTEMRCVICDSELMLEISRGPWIHCDRRNFYLQPSLLKRFMLYPDKWCMKDITRWQKTHQKVNRKLCRKQNGMHTI